MNQSTNQQADERSVAVVIVSHNTCAVLRRCLDSIVREGGPSIREIIVVDNASTDDTRAMIGQEFPSVRLLANDVNRGFGVASNQGVAEATARYVLLLNSDTMLVRGGVELLLTHLRQHPQVGLVGPRLVNVDGTAQRSACRFPSPLFLLLEQLNLARYLLPLHSASDSNEPRAFGTDYLVGACLLGKRDLLRRAGPFDPRFFMYAEDIDLCYRLRADGWQIQLVPNATVVHLGGASSRLDYEAMGLQATRSMYLFYLKHYGPRDLHSALVIFRMVAVLKLVRDLGRWLCLRTGGIAQPRLRADMRLWFGQLTLSPPALVAEDHHTKSVQGIGSSQTTAV